MTRLGKSLMFAIVCLMAATSAHADDWRLHIATWNLRNFGDRKAGIRPGPLKVQLLDRYATIMSLFDIVVLEEIEDGGASVTQGIALRQAMGNFNCNTLSAAAGRQGRRERYAVCYRNRWAGQGESLTITGTLDYSVGPPPNRQAADGTQQPAAQVWMRPPLQVDFLYTPRQGHGNPYAFTLFVMHTMPRYNMNRLPQGLPPAHPTTSSVYYELRAMEQNRGVGLNGAAVIGDLNSDCASYPLTAGNLQIRGHNFNAPFQWLVPYGTRTNVGANFSCAYDQVISDNTLQLVTLPPWGIFKPGIGQFWLPTEPRIMVNGEVVSDHYLVWFTIGREPPEPPSRKRPALMVSSQTMTGLTDPSTSPGIGRKFVKMSNPTLHFDAQGIRVAPAVATAKLYVVAYDPTRFYNGNAPYPLVDVRGQPTSVSIGSDGTLTTDVTWAHPSVAGAYNLVFNARGDGVFDRTAGDFTTYDNQADFIVDDGPVEHSQVVTLDDRTVSREVFNAGVANNIYVKAHGFTPRAVVRSYVVSRQLLLDYLAQNHQTFTTWEALRSAGTLPLDAVSVPINVVRDPIRTSPNAPDPLKPEDKYKLLKVDENGNLFAAAWESPINLVSSRVFYDAAPAPPVNWPETPPPGDDVDAEPCQDAGTDSAFPDLNRACNSGTTFADYYGTDFSIVIDANHDGILDAGDGFDAHDIGDMTSYFQTHDRLDASTTDPLVISEYKEYLSEKLALNVPLDPPADAGHYDAMTRAASRRYLCTQSLSKRQFNNIIKPGAQVGFRVFDSQTYATYQTMGSGLYNFIDARIDINNLASDTDACITGRNVLMHFARSQGTPAPNSTVHVDAEIDGLAAISGNASGTNLNVNASEVSLGPGTRITSPPRAQPAPAAPPLATIQASPPISFKDDL
jgi:hypothetical protein